MNLVLMSHTEKPNLLSIDQLEKYIVGLCDSYGYIKTKDLNIPGPEYLYYEDALELLKWNYIKRGFYGNASC
jgi:hypothetical protein